MPAPTRWLSGLLAVSVLLIGPADTASASVDTPHPSTRAVGAESPSVRDGRWDFNRAYLIKTSRYVIDDFRTIDHRIVDGISVSSAMYLLSNSYGYMIHAGVPPNVRKKSVFVARISTLSEFAELAGDEYFDDEVSALARYSVIKQQARILFNQINASLGTAFVVPN